MQGSGPGPVADFVKEKEKDKPRKVICPLCEKNVNQFLGWSAHYQPWICYTCKCLIQIEFFE